MRMKSSYKKTIALWLMALLVLAGGCAKKVVNNTQGESISVSISAKILLPGEVNAIHHFILVVEGRDFGAREVPMVFEQGLITATVEVPSGTARRFVARALDINNVVLYEGETTVDIQRGTEITLDINLYPVVPMMNITPHFQSRMMTQSFSMNVNVFSIPNLAQATFVVHYPTDDNLILLDSIVRGRDLDTTTWVSYETGALSPEVWVSVYQSNQPGTIVDSVGNAHLVTLYFSTHNNTVRNIDTAVFNIELSQLQRGGSDVYDTIPLDSVTTDNARVELYQIPVQITWERTFGAAGDDIGRSVCAAHGDGYIAVGETYSFSFNSLADVYMIKVDPQGNLVWQKNLGGDGTDRGHCVAATDDGGYIISGSSNSFSYDSISTEIYLIKTDGSGNVDWQKTYDMPGARGYSVQQTPDGGYIVGGTVTFYGGGTSVIMVKTNSAGDTLWTRMFEGSGFDAGSSVALTFGGDYIIAGESQSIDLDMNASLIGVSSLGDPLWQKSHGGIYTDNARFISHTRDGNFIVVGTSNSFDPGYYGFDVYVIKVTSMGGEIWRKTYGGSGTQDGYGIRPTRDGGYVYAGLTIPDGAEIADVYIGKTGSLGTPQWANTFGGPGDDVGYSIIQTGDGGYVIVGYTNSSGAGGHDVYMIKTDVRGKVSSLAF